MQRSKVLKEQKKLLYLMISGVVLLSFIILYAISEPTSETQPKRHHKVELASDTVDPQESWNLKIQDQLALVDRKMQFVDSVILDSKKNEANYKKINAELSQKVSNLEKELQYYKSEKETIFKQEIKNESPDPFLIQGQEISQQRTRRPLSEKRVESTRNLVKNVKNVIPATTTVKAVMVSSVDAPCGTYSSSDPQPVKLQILDDGHLSKCVRAKLKGASVIASAYGDLSSERIYIRLERLTQVKPSGDFIETCITGFVTGEDGKYGVRGTVVDKSAKLVSNVALSGVLSGVNSFFQAYAASRWGPYCGYGCGPCPGGYDNEECSAKEFAYGLAAQGGTQGVGNAFDALTDYYIKRAELIKPVIQVSAGRIVDITFTVGTELGDLNAQEVCAKIRTKSREEECLKG